MFVCCSRPLTNTNASSESAGVSVNVNTLVALSPEKLLVDTLLIVPVVPLPPPLVCLNCKFENEGTSIIFRS